MHLQLPLDVGNMMDEIPSKTWDLVYIRLHTLFEDVTERAHNSINNNMTTSFWRRNTAQNLHKYARLIITDNDNINVDIRGVRSLASFWRQLPGTKLANF